MKALKAVFYGFLIGVSIATAMNMYKYLFTFSKKEYLDFLQKFYPETFFAIIVLPTLFVSIVSAVYFFNKLRKL